MAITFEAYARNNGAFKAARPMPTGSPAGIIIHSTGANNPNLKRYVNASEICGENPYKNYFDRADSDVCPHAVIGKDKNGEVKAAKLLPWNVCCWGCGSGSKGSYNYSPAYIQIEIAEDALNDRAYFEEAFGLASDLCQRLMKNYPTIKPGNIISHKEACARGYASNHGDPEHWLARFGKNMDWFRSLVAPEKQVRITAEITVGQSKADEVSAKLRGLGCSVKVDKQP
jgi:N-acetylmuramoyl-L-alanine amidase